LIEIVDGNANSYASSDGEANDDCDSGHRDEAGKDEQYHEMNEPDEPPVGGSSRRSTAGKLNSQRMQLLNQQLRVTVQNQ
jgi:hypothetical protein